MLTRSPADRYKKMVYDFLANHCGAQFVESLPQTSYHQTRFPSPTDSFYATAASVQGAAAAGTAGGMFEHGVYAAELAVVGGAVPQGMHHLG